MAQHCKTLVLKKTDVISRPVYKCTIDDHDDDDQPKCLSYINDQKRCLRNLFKVNSDNCVSDMSVWYETKIKHVKRWNILIVGYLYVPSQKCKYDGKKEMQSKS